MYPSIPQPTSHALRLPPRKLPRHLLTIEPPLLIRPLERQQFGDTPRVEGSALGDEDVIGLGYGDGGGGGEDEGGEEGEEEGFEESGAHGLRCWLRFRGSWFGR